MSSNLKKRAHQKRLIIVALQWSVLEPKHSAPVRQYNHLAFK